MNLITLILESHDVLFFISLTTLDLPDLLQLVGIHWELNRQDDFVDATSP